MEKRLTCLIVEDEPLAAAGLADFVQQTPFLELVGSCPDALAALHFLKNRPDLGAIFLDIHLPGLKGLDFLRTLRHRPQVILTTAFHQYALDGYELDVVDYLLKPFSFARFLQAAGKLKLPESPPSLAQTAREFHFFQEEKRRVKVFFEDILFAESVGEYSRIHLADGRRVFTKMALGEVDKLPGGAAFLLRIHRSFVVNLQKMESFSANEIGVGEHRLPIGRSHKMEVERRLDGLA